MANALNFVLTAIGSAVEWLGSWRLFSSAYTEGIPFLYFFIGLGVITVLMRYAL